MNGINVQQTNRGRIRHGQERKRKESANTSRSEPQELANYGVEYTAICQNQVSRNYKMAKYKLNSSRMALCQKTVSNESDTEQYPMSERRSIGLDFFAESLHMLRERSEKCIRR